MSSHAMTAQMSQYNNLSSDLGADHSAFACFKRLFAVLRWLLSLGVGIAAHSASNLCGRRIYVRETSRMRVRIATSTPQRTGTSHSPCYELASQGDILLHARLRPVDMLDKIWIISGGNMLALTLIDLPIINSECQNLLLKR
ncbi:hypothetical protein BD769DRAFT_1028984 [Suillus cothurnatus]|nr:hypothetical protein BD769DRAFT_1028984 [Suillus cothurnatus]